MGFRWYLLFKIICIVLLIKYYHCHKRQKTIVLFNDYLKFYEICGL
jgi:hypothetical protein